MELSTQGNGTLELEMVLVVKCGQMAQDMRATGNLIKLTVKENLYMLTETYMKANGSMIKLMAKERTLMQMEPTIMEIGLMINNMVSEWNPGQMVQNMKETTLMERKKARVSLLLLTAATMKVSSNRMKYAAMESTTGQTVSNTTDNGVIIKCMEKESSFGKIKRNTKANS